MLRNKENVTKYECATQSQLQKILIAKTEQQQLCSQKSISILFTNLPILLPIQELFLGSFISTQNV
jgi:hypothetical protein